MESIKTTIGDIRKKSSEEIAKMIAESDHPEFTKRLLDEIRSKPPEKGDEVAFIQWGWSAA